MNPNNPSPTQSNTNPKPLTNTLAYALLEKDDELTAFQDEQKRRAIDALIKARCAYFIAARNAKNLNAGDDLEKSILSVLECMGADGATWPELMATHRKRENLERAVATLTNDEKIKAKFTGNRMVLVLA
jgi:hypothetical protein